MFVIHVTAAEDPPVRLARKIGGSTGGEMQQEPGMDFSDADRLMAAAEGAYGETACGLATGYLMAIRDAQADSYRWTELDRDLAENSSRQWIAVGFMMGVRDDIASACGLSAEGRSRAPEALLRWAREVRRRAGPGQDTGQARAYDVLAAGLLDSAARRSPNPSGRRARVSPRAALTAIALALMFALPPLGPREPDRAVALHQRAADIETLMLEERRFEKDTFLNVGDRAKAEAYLLRWQQTKSLMESAIAAARSLQPDDQERAALANIERDFEAYASGYEQIAGLIRQGAIRSAEEANAHLLVYKASAHRVEDSSAQLRAATAARLTAPNPTV
jgi:hypothetical protein